MPMRRKHFTRKQEEAQVNITPMLDIVFILLIFFIVTATFILESGIDVTRPDTPENELQKKERAILVQINNNNDIYIERRVIDLRAVRANIERLRAENPKSPVIIQTQREADTGVLVNVLDQALLAKAPVSIAPLEDVPNI